MPALSRSALASAAQVSRQSVHKALKSGRLVAGPDGSLDPADPVNARWVASHRGGHDVRGRPLSSHVGGRPAAKFVPGATSPILEPHSTEVAAPSGWDIEHVVGVIAELLARQDRALLQLLESFERRLARVEELAAAAADHSAVKAAIADQMHGLAEMPEAIERLQVETRAQAAAASTGTQTQAAKLDDLRRLLADLVRLLSDHWS
jgi:hypothetical protein